MGNRLLRIGVFAIPAVLTAAMLLVSACGDDDDGIANNNDASVDAPAADSTRPDTSTPPPDSAVPPNDAGIPDADAAVDATLPALCLAYPDTVFPGDANASEPPDFTRYQLIALRAIYSGDRSAITSCEVNEHFFDDQSPPEFRSCLGEQLAAVVGCQGAVGPRDYTKAVDQNGGPCITPDGGPEVQLGLRNPKTSAYTRDDVDFIIKLVTDAALSTGMAAADVARLKALLEAERNKVTGFGSDAGVDAGFSNSTCP